ncbi:tRNA (adenine-N1)-methyltransferase [Gulosibacter molinativorax]|uniref:tRNA (Adenine-N1)-methyltransferase n=1 Tax=Gulosibacter molinativorax TaxID=256821 RepID=A0ABT7C4J3_9MICO|nr:tRNA (adenine-N1)-methyltransferase [Gulosibacter molinativorax]MDJ1370133.1 tRNA (adenine-N1)-methyltransferase [Gulosibacter molinativorax]QUY61544.1 tRNA (Adenine(58)-N(1))-methyltransferase TrmI [Gulosibacter molinativorax]
MHDAAPASGPFQAGERVQLTDPKGRPTTVWLEPGEALHSHQGALEHDRLIGLPDGSVVENSEGVPYLALRPLLWDVVMSMPRGAAIIYPKDAAMILAKADIRPGVRVVEAGVGSGGLSMWILRALAGTGELKSFERRPEFAEIARGNVVSVVDDDPKNWEIVLGDLADALPETYANGTVDRVVLDMLAPWECLDVVADALVPGGVVLCYVATATQLSRVAEEIRATGKFTEPQADETMVRGWHVQGLAVRPDHRMVAHTGFLITARRLAPGTVLPAKQPRGSKTPASLEDTEAWTPSEDEAWTPEAVGERYPSDKILRKRGREAQRGADHRTAAAESGAAQTDSAAASPSDDIMDADPAQHPNLNEGKATE